MKADPLSAQVEIATCTWDVLPRHLKTGNNVDYVCCGSPNFDHSATVRNPRGGGDGRLRLQRSCEFHNWRDFAGRGRHRHGARLKIRGLAVLAATASVKPSRLASGRRFRLRS